VAKGITHISIWRVNGKRLEATTSQRASELHNRYGKPAYEGFRARFRRVGCKSLSRTFDTFEAAKAWLGKITKSAEDGERPIDATKMLRTVTIKMLLREHEDKRAKREFGYNNSTRYRINAIIRRIGDVSLFEARNPHFWTDYCDERRQSVSDDTVARELNLIQGAWEAAKTYDDLPIAVGKENPIRRGREQARLHLKHARERRLVAEEESRLLHAAAAYGQGKTAGLYVHVIVLLLETAIALSDLMRIRWSDVNLDEMEMTVPARRKGRRSEKQPPPRHLALSQLAVEGLESIRDALGGEEYVMGSLRAHTVSQAFHRITQHADIHDLRLHDLRHEGASRFFHRGLSIKEVSVYTGHRTLEMLGRYTHPSVAELRRRLEATEPPARPSSPV